MTVNPTTHSIEIPHLGVTLRTIMGAASVEAGKHKPFRRSWNIIYKGAFIGKIQLADSEEK